MTHEGKRDFAKDLELFDKLVVGNHWSPFEHVATPFEHTEMCSGPFVGWDQLRKHFRDENLPG